MRIFLIVGLVIFVHVAVKIIRHGSEWLILKRKSHQKRYPLIFRARQPKFITVSPDISQRGKAATKTGQLSDVFSGWRRVDPPSGFGCGFAGNRPVSCWQPNEFVGVETRSPMGYKQGYVVTSFARRPRSRSVLS
jgi:hypothetical protein